MHIADLSLWAYMLNATANDCPAETLASKSLFFLMPI